MYKLETRQFIHTAFLRAWRELGRAGNAQSYWTRNEAALCAEIVRNAPKPSPARALRDYALRPDRGFREPAREDGVRQMTYGELKRLIARFLDSRRIAGRAEIARALLDIAKATEGPGEE